MKLPLPRSRRAFVITLAVVLGIAGISTGVALALGPHSLTVTAGGIDAGGGAATGADDGELPAMTPGSAATADAEVDAPAATTVAAVNGAGVSVRDAPRGNQIADLPAVQKSGAPLVFRVVAEKDGWLQVMLPQRPNGSTGWVDADAVSQSTTGYALVVTVSSNTLDLYKDGMLQKTFPVATGTGGTPTPYGRFALSELLAPTNEGYGPFAYGTTAFSDVLNSFGGGPGQIGLHGTEDVDSIGTAASHGCVRMHNADITELAGLLPLGTPFQVR